MDKHFDLYLENFNYKNRMRKAYVYNFFIRYKNI